MKYIVNKRLIANQIVLVEYKGLKFLITDSPDEWTIDTCVNQLNEHGVTALVRVCESNYRLDKLEAKGVAVFDLQFEDGSFPPKEIIKEWFRLLKYHFYEKGDGCIAIHCKSGLGRAPVMVALALIELGMKYEDAVEMIRNKQRGAINAKQLQFLETYRRKNRLQMQQFKWKDLFACN